MEKNETIFIFAGYSNEMYKFLNLNPGIKSRIGYYFDFKDYTNEELLKMFENKLSKSGFKITEDAKNMVYEIIKERSKKKDFGNGRMIDNLYGEIIREHASLNRNKTDEKKLLTINKNSVEKLYNTKI